MIIEPSTQQRQQQQMQQAAQQSQQFYQQPPPPPPPPPQQQGGLQRVAVPQQGAQPLPPDPTNPNQVPVAPPGMPAGPRVMIAIPTYQDADWRFMISFDALKEHCKQNNIYYVFSPSWNYGVAETRERFIDIMLGMQDITHMFFLDSDMIVPAEAIKYLLEADKDIVSGIYWNSLFTGLAAWVNETPIAAQQQTNLVQVDKIGFGCTLIKRQVFEQIRNQNFRPAFYYNTSSNIIHSEDFYFCNLVNQKMGIKPWVDTRVQAGHMKRLIVRHDGSVGI